MDWRWGRKKKEDIGDFRISILGEWWCYLMRWERLAGEQT